MPIIKANGYGIGAVEVARTLGIPFDDGVEPSQAPWGVGISSLDEAQKLRDAGCTGRIFCATPLLPLELPRALALKVRPALHRMEDITYWWRLSKGRAPYHLSIDTGMSRAGERWDEVSALRSVLEKAPPEGVFTHFHSVDESIVSRNEQDSRFREALAALAGVLPATVLLHSDNSGAIASRQNGSPGHLARPGIALYAGLYASELGLRQVIHLRARVVDVRDVLPYESVSYGATWIAAPGKVSRVATLAVGYADGYPWHFSNSGRVIIDGTICPIVGRVTMDMTMVDVTEIPCAVGDVATLLGSDSGLTLSIEEETRRSRTFPYELLVGLGLRIPVFYHDVLPSSI